MKYEDIIKRLEELNLNQEEYWVIAGSAMVLYGIKLETKDIDLGCTTKFADVLEKKYKPTICKDGTRCFHIGNDVEIFENWLEDRVVFISSIPVVSIDGLISMKRKLGRDKDLKDIEIIKQYINDMKKR